MAKLVACERCSRLIKVRSDLVTSTVMFQVVAYHEDCYAKELKGVKSFFLDNYPINGMAGTLMMLAALVVGISYLIITPGPVKYIGIVGLVPLFYQLYSYAKFEKHIEK